MLAAPATNSTRRAKNAPRTSDQDNNCRHREFCRVMRAAMPGSRVR
jgi:hypothetical protein